MKIYPCGEEVKKEEFPISGDSLKGRPEGVYECSDGLRVVHFTNGSTHAFVLVYSDGQSATSADGYLSPSVKYRHLPNARVCLEIK